MNIEEQFGVEFPKVGDVLIYTGPAPLTWWDRFLWRLFRIKRKRRVWGVGPTAEVAETECVRAAEEYAAQKCAAGRRYTLDGWTFDRAAQ